MASITPPAIGKDWTLIYDPAVSGDFTGLLSPTNSVNTWLHVSDTEPSASTSGAQITQQFMVSLIGDNKLWGRSVPGNGLVQMDGDFAPSAFPAGVFEGSRAIGVQSYAEANVKEGVEYEHSLHNDAVAIGAALCFVINVGSKPCIIKGINLGIDGTEATYQIFRTPAYTGGTAGVIYNRNDRNPVAGEITITDAPTVTNQGTPVSAPFVFLGSAGVGQSDPATGGTVGLDHLLAPNTEYLLCFENTGDEAERLALFISFYEGLTDLPRP